MAKEEGTKTVVVGGKKDVEQRYCGTVGGQSTDFSTIDTEVKVKPPYSPPSQPSPLIHSSQTALLKNNSLAPPDLCVPLVLILLTSQLNVFHRSFNL
jgi:hypothetical protein